jgi:hypothetical protein
MAGSSLPLDIAVQDRRHSGDVAPFLRQISLVTPLDRLQLRNDIRACEQKRLAAAERATRQPLLFDGDGV